MNVLPPDGATGGCYSGKESSVAVGEVDTREVGTRRCTTCGVGRWWYSGLVKGRDRRRRVWSGAAVVVEFARCVCCVPGKHTRETTLVWLGGCQARGSMHDPFELCWLTSNRLVVSR